MKKIKGIMPALVTPLKDDRVTLNSEALCELLSYHKSLNADGFYIAGATGEGLALSMKTKMELIEQSVAEIGKEPLKIVHVADMNFENTKLLAKHAQAVGADVISAIPPIYFGYGPEDIYNYYKEIAANVDIPLMLYYTPSANTTLNTDLFVRLNKIDNITSVKWTMKDYYKVMELINATEGRMTVINGPDEMLVCGLSAGCAGGIGTTYNIMLPYYQEIYRLFNEGDIKGAGEVQRRADRIVGVLIKYGAIPATKAVLEEMGFEVGNASFPMRIYTPEERASLVSEMKTAGFPYFLCKKSR